MKDFLTMENMIKLLFLAFSFGMLYQKVDSIDYRLQRLESFTYRISSDVR